MTQYFYTGSSITAIYGLSKMRWRLQTYTAYSWVLLITVIQCIGRLFYTQDSDNLLWNLHLGCFRFLGRTLFYIYNTYCIVTRTLWYHDFNDKFNIEQYSIYSRIVCHTLDKLILWNTRNQQLLLFRTTSFAILALEFTFWIDDVLLEDLTLT